LNEELQKKLNRLGLCLALSNALIVPIIITKEIVNEKEAFWIVVNVKGG